MSVPSDSKGHALEYSIVKASDHAVLGGVRSTGGAAIAAATTLTPSDSGNTFHISQAAAYAITLPVAGDIAGCSYRFVLTTAGANTVTITLPTAPDVFNGVILNNTDALAVSGTTINFIGTTAVAGAYVDVRALSSTEVHVSGASSATGGITVTGGA